MRELEASPHYEPRGIGFAQARTNPHRTGFPNPL
jgi:hypothetical protein